MDETDLVNRLEPGQELRGDVLSLLELQRTPLLQDAEQLGVSFRRVWFNGREQLDQLRRPGLQRARGAVIAGVGAWGTIVVIGMSTAQFSRSQVATANAAGSVA